MVTATPLSPTECVAMAIPMIGIIIVVIAIGVHAIKGAMSDLTEDEPVIVVEDDDEKASVNCQD